jgi:nucleoside 2-deoxyribosyltransferase
MPERNPVLRRFPKQKFNAFLMMRFRPGKQYKIIVETLEEEADRYAINLLRADNQSYSSDLWENVRLYMNACDLGIAVFEQLEIQDFNPNVSLELGYMLANARAVLLLKEKNLTSLPTDIVGKLYQEFDANDLEPSIRAAVRRWFRDIGIAKGHREKLVVFVSAAGKDRCAMAKVIAESLFKEREAPFPLRFVSMAASRGNAVTASPYSREAVTNYYKEDRLASHRVMRRCDGIIEDADLILVMEAQFLQRFPAEKTFLITEFFGKSGNIDDPWPSKVVADYERCFNQLRVLIEDNPERILAFLSTPSAP